MTDKILEVISLGAGVQSSTMALMALKGVFTSKPDCAIFADTGNEPKSVYVWLNWLEQQLPFPVYRVTRGNLGETVCKIRKSKNNILYTKSNIPAFIIDKDKKMGPLMRQCTTDFKITVIHRKVRELLKGMKSSLPCKKKCNMWIGISADEIIRMKPSRKKYITNVFPLITINMSRAGCIRWLRDNGFPIPPRSACVFCPYHRDKEWEHLKNEEPEEFMKAVEMEKNMQKTFSQLPHIRGTVYLHRSCVPLDKVVFSKQDNQLELFGNECEGMCGV